MGVYGINTNNGKGSQYRVNEDIKSKEVRLIGVEGESLGVVSIEKALNLAEDAQLDLVEVSPTANPPVCKIIDYGKYLFEIAKKQKETKKNQKTMTTKEVWIKPNIEKHDFDTKARMATRFLQEGNKVKVSLRFRGREMNYIRMGEEVINRFIVACESYGESEFRPKVEGRNLLTVISPSQKKNK